MSADKKTIYIADAHNFLHRNYHALPKLSTSQGLEVGALYGFVRWLVKLVEEKKPHYVAVCFDSRGGSTKRKKMFSDYKAHRKPVDEALLTQLQLAREVVSGMGLKVFAVQGIEADDIIGFIAKKSVAEGADAVLATSDKDALQLLNEHIKLWPAGAAKESLKGPDYVKEKFNIAQKYLTDYLAIVGDSSDNVPGVAGLGPKTAAELINNFGYLEDIIKEAKAGNPKIKKGAAQKIIDNEAVAILSKQLVTLDENIPMDFTLEDAVFSPPAPAKLSELFAKYEFKNLLSAFDSARPKNTPEGELFSQDTEIKQGISFNEVVNKIKDKMFIQTDENFVLISADSQTCCLEELDNLTQEELLKIEELANNKQILKISYDVKFTLRALDVTPKEIINCFDVRLAAYSLNPGADIGFKALAAQYLDVIIEPKDEKEFLTLQNQYIWSLKEVLERDLKEKDQFKIFNELELPLITVLLAMEEIGVLVDKAWLENFSKTLEGEIAAIQNDINKDAQREINVNSPKQLGALLFDQLKLPSVKKTKTGYSTDEEVLQQLVNLHPIVKKILEYRSNAKLKSTYVDNLIMLADGNSRVHTYLDQTGTVTGRLSSSSPNLQNIPIRTPKGRMLRRAFVAEGGKTLLSVDYSQIDLRLLAHESQDSVLVNAFKEGGDIHTKTAAEVFGVMREMVSDEMRSSAKAINFGIIYGQGPMGLSQNLNISVREAKEYIDNYFAVYKGVREWIDKNIALARERGYVKTLLGHIRYLPEFKMGSGHMASFAQRAAINTIVQGGSADVIKKAMADIFNHYKGTEVKMLLQVHDELIFELPEKNLLKEAAVIKNKMEHTIELKVPLLAEAKTGVNWYEMEKLKL
ncbi:DNA polymerase [Elusimicrobium minutum Pei191]|uniref:DNA polymerase I n=1 Tax=Elusimicrobium minutum (strain Pei191) TaxID=445932 RepID=B2KCD2_ELUMP|nr:DNA polymerase I [Elusimicrobium minutum]ACC98053.1 DNA polymerase [Elusimicrobium minutum Pei191]